LRPGGRRGHGGRRRHRAPASLDQVQEVTLTFIPKIIVILVVTAVTAPFIGTVIYTFAEQVYARIEVGF